MVDPAPPEPAGLPPHLDRVTAGSVALLGLPTDHAVSFEKGAAQGPAAVRAALHSHSTNLALEDGRDLGEEARFVDAGDVDLEIPPPSPEDLPPAEAATGGEEGSAAGAGRQIRQRIEAAAGAILDRGGKPLALGGDHSVTLPLLRAVAARQGAVTVLHLDAHADLYHQFEGARHSHACVFARVLEEELTDRLVQVGVRTLNPPQRRQVDRFGVDVVDMALWHRQPRRPEFVVGRLPVSADRPLYLSLDLDVLDPAFAPAVAHPEPGGLTVREVVDLIQRLPSPLVAADVVELTPHREPLVAGSGARGAAEPSDLTARVAAKLVREIAGRLLE